MITADVKKSIEEAERLRVEIGFHGTLAEMLNAAVAIFVYRHSEARAQRAEAAVGRRLR